MAQIIGHKESIKNRKRKLLIITIILLCAVFVLFSFKTLLTQRLHFFVTFITVLFILGTGYYGVRLMMFLPYKDGDEKIFARLEKLPDHVSFLCGTLLNDETKRLYFDYILITRKSVIFAQVSSNNKKYTDKDVLSFCSKLLEERQINLKAEVVSHEESLVKRMAKLNQNDNSMRTTSDQERAAYVLQFLSL